MSNNYKATKEQMLMKKARRYNIVTEGMIADLKDNKKNGKQIFANKLAAVIKGYEVSKNSYARNCVNGR